MGTWQDDSQQWPDLGSLGSAEGSSVITEIPSTKSGGEEAVF